MKREVIIKNSTVSLPPGFLTKVFFGKTIEELAQEILENRDGKYDRCYTQQKGA